MAIASPTDEPTDEAFVKSAIDQPRTLTPEGAAPQTIDAADAAGEVLASLQSDPEHFRDSATVGCGLAIDPGHSNPKMVATRARKAGKIFGAWDGNAYRYPAFQFDADKQPWSSVRELIQALPRDPDGSGRDAALWLFAPDAALDERTPADVFPEDPTRVISLARRRRGDSADAD